MRAEHDIEWAGVGVPVQAAAASSTARLSAKAVITPGRLRTWGWLSALSLVDQALTSGAGFAVNLLLARWMAPEVYGAFAVAFAGFLFVSGFHNVLLLEPMSVMGPSRYAGNLRAYFRLQLVVHAILVGALSGLSLIGGMLLWRVIPGSPLIGAVLGAGLTLPFLLLFWLTRRMCYVVQRPSIAVLGSGFYLCLVVGGLFALERIGLLGPFTSFLLIGCGSILASGILLWRLGLTEYEATAEPDATWRVALRENWAYGRWLVGSTTLYSISSQTQTFLTAGILGLGTAGVLRAMQLPSLVMAQVVTATGLLVLPTLSREYGDGRIDRLRHKAHAVSLVLTSGALVYAGFLCVFAGPVAHLLFGERFRGYEKLMCLMALIPICTGFGSGFTLSLRAMQRPKWDLLINSIVAPIGILSGLALIAKWGMWGAGLSLVLVSAAIAAGNFVCLRFLFPGGSTSNRSKANGQR
jgi:O-antigen/teichoic acid export membrane protein